MVGNKIINQLIIWANRLMCSSINKLGFSLLFLIACSSEKINESRQELSVQKVLQTEIIDFIPYLMTKSKIDTVYEIITEGKINFLKVGDTLSYYTLKSDTVYHKFKGVMCCENLYHFKNGLLMHQVESSDYTLISDFDYQRDQNFIYKMEHGKFNDTIKYRVFEDKMKWKVSILNDIQDTTFFYYKDELLNRSERLENFSGNTNQYIKSFEYNKSNKTILKIVEKTIGRAINTTSVTFFDEQGFPKITIGIQNTANTNDTIFESTFIK